MSAATVSRPSELLQQTDDLVHVLGIGPRNGVEVVILDDIQIHEPSVDPITGVRVVRAGLYGGQDLLSCGEAGYYRANILQGSRRPQEERVD